ncbi:mannan endo-1,4-beta-mannosidase [Reichenbachiella agariperforans]|uniref:Mannan endo-1,4-beta-mannosidase n=2 Tax=Reichenbachiella agariperforans TaxID=156994 RepID=A0A1M6S147_REIAG|nr:mannan endo-1,4-beta-mannosidase [Reichenbachiella agariperforans]
MMEASFIHIYSKKNTDMTKFTYSLLILASAFLMACSTDESTVDPDGDGDGGSVEPVTLQLVDKSATDETKALYANLWDVQSRGMMFGHHDDLLYGREWYAESGRSDTKEVCGDYPAVFSVDFAEVMDERYLSSDLNDDRKRTIMEARARGEVITACLHLNNPKTGGDSWDNSDNTVVKGILEEGSEVNMTYKVWLDRLATFVTSLKDENGKLIPIIFRPYHEHTQSWSWWGSSCTTQEEFISFWKFTVDYLTLEMGVHNLIFAISPQIDSEGTVDNLLYRWPGDDYVDFIGMDSYHGTNTKSLATNSRNLATLSKEKLKPCGVTETGIEGVRKDGKEYTDYWTQEIMSAMYGKGVSLVVMWRNKYDPTGSGYHYYGPWIGHSSANDFVTFYESDYMLFSSDLPDMYEAVEGITVQ